jgi:predicted metal-binding protein
MICPQTSCIFRSFRIKSVLVQRIANSQNFAERNHQKMYEKKRFETRISVDTVLEKYYDFTTTYSRCQKCPGYGQTWSCPDFDFDPADFWKTFKTFHLIVDQISNAGAKTAKDAMDRLFMEKDRFDLEMREIEKTLPGSYALAAQECVRCKRCSRLSGLPCVHPEVMRYGPEAIGILAINMVRETFQLETLWSDGISIPDYYLLIGGIIEP